MEREGRGLIVGYSEYTQKLNTFKTYMIYLI